MNTIYILQKFARSNGVVQRVEDSYFDSVEKANRRIAELVEAERVEAEAVREYNINSFNEERAARSGRFEKFVDHLLGVDTLEPWMTAPFDVEAATRRYRVLPLTPAVKG